MFSTTPSLDRSRFSLRIVALVSLICVAPQALNVAGVDLGVGGLVAVDDEHRLARAVGLHTVLEWSAFCVALFTGLVALMNYSLRRDLVAAVIGVGLIAAGVSDAVHALALAPLLESADVEVSLHLEPFTWILCRCFAAGILIVGVALIFLRRSEIARVPAGDRMTDPRFILLVTALFAAVGYLVLTALSRSGKVPEIYTQSAISRPADLIPLMLFLGAGLLSYLLYTRERSLFSHGLLMSVLPSFAAQVYLAFGSAELFDHNFHAAHLLKIIAYAIPLLGLMLDYVRTYQDEVAHRVWLQQLQIQLTDANQSLQTQIRENRRVERRLRESNQELMHFASVAAHDLQSPLRKVQVFADRLEGRFGDQIPEGGRTYLARMIHATRRMRALVDDLLAFSRVTTRARPFSSVDLDEIIQGVIADLELQIEESGGQVVLENLPSIEADATQIRQLFQNLIGNALKFSRPGIPPVVHVRGAVVTGEGDEPAEICALEIQDNGIGFDEKFLDRIFEVFQRLHQDDSDYAGTGIGLAVCRKIVVRHRGSISARSTPDEGACFVVRLPVTQVDIEESSEPPFSRVSTSL